MTKADQGKLYWLAACDESGMGGAKYYGFGSIWMKYQRRGDIWKHLRPVIEKHHFEGEIKWQKANNRRYTSFYKEVIDFFFDRSWLAFHCLLVRQGYVDRSLHKSYDEARRKHYGDLITNKVGRIIRSHPGRQCLFRIIVDPIPSQYKKADEVLGIVANNELERDLKTRYRPIESVLSRDSKQSITIQLSDLLLGAVLEAWQQKAQSPAKLAIQKHIAEHLGWPDLRADTHPSERKFNVWYLYNPQGGPREVETRKVALKKPLPITRRMW